MQVAHQNPQYVHVFLLLLHYISEQHFLMLHLVMDEAVKRNKKVGILFIDLEGQYKLTIDHIVQCYEM
jgi:hypothetical protein